MPKKHQANCGCAICNKRKPFSFPEHLLDAVASGDAVPFVGAGISTENRTYCQSTFYEEVRAELKTTENASFPDLMSKYCERPDGRIRLLQKIKARIDYFLSFDDLYRPMAAFHKAISPLRSDDDRSPKPPFYDVPLDTEFTSLAKISNFPAAKIPKPLADQAKRMLKGLPKAAALIPDHTPFL